MSQENSDKTLELNALGKKLANFFEHDDIQIATANDFARFSEWMGGARNEWSAVYNKIKKFDRTLKPHEMGKIQQVWKSCCDDLEDEEGNADDGDVDSSDTDREPKQKKHKGSKVSTALIPAELYKDKWAKLKETVRVPKKLKPSHKHVSDIQNSVDTGVYPVLRISQMTTTSKAIEKLREQFQTKPKNGYVPDGDGDWCPVADVEVDPSVMSYYKVCEAIKVHDYATSLLGLAPHGSWSPHVDKIEEIGEQFQFSRGQEILDTELRVRGEIQELHLELGGDLQAAIAEVYQDGGEAHALWNRYVCCVDPGAFCISF